MSRSVLLAVLLAFGAPAGPVPSAVEGDFWRDAPEYLPLVAPAGPRRAAYRTYVTALDLDTVLARLEGNPQWLAPPRAWKPQSLLPFDAFGQTGRYDRYKLAQVYGSRHAEVARGPVGRNGVVTESWTLVSPYPDPALDRLQSGTLLIVLSLRSP
jgi:hypothetical protein